MGERADMMVTEAWERMPAEEGIISCKEKKLLDLRSYLEP